MRGTLHAHKGTPARSTSSRQNDDATAFLKARLAFGWLKSQPDPPAEGRGGAGLLTEQWCQLESGVSPHTHWSGMWLPPRPHPGHMSHPTCPTLPSGGGLAAGGSGEGGGSWKRGIGRAGQELLWNVRGLSHSRKAWGGGGGPILSSWDVSTCPVLKAGGGAARGRFTCAPLSAGCGRGWQTCMGGNRPPGSRPCSAAPQVAWQRCPSAWRASPAQGGDPPGCGREARLCVSRAGSGLWGVVSEGPAPCPSCLKSRSMPPRERALDRDNPSKMPFAGPRRAQGSQSIFDRGLRGRSRGSICRARTARQASCSTVTKTRCSAVAWGTPGGLLCAFQAWAAIWAAVRDPQTRSWLRSGGREGGRQVCSATNSSSSPSKGTDKAGPAGGRGGGAASHPQVSACVWAGGPFCLPCGRRCKGPPRLALVTLLQSLLASRRGNPLLPRPSLPHTHGGGWLPRQGWEACSSSRLLSGNRNPDTSPKDGGSSRSTVGASMLCVSSPSQSGPHGEGAGPLPQSIEAPAGLTEPPPPRVVLLGWHISH